MEGLVRILFNAHILLMKKGCSCPKSYTYDLSCIDISLFDSNDFHSNVKRYYVLHSDIRGGVYIWMNEVIEIVKDEVITAMSMGKKEIVLDNPCCTLDTCTWKVCYDAIFNCLARKNNFE